MINSGSDADARPRPSDLLGTLDNNDWSLSDAAAREAQRLLTTAQHQLTHFDVETPPGSAESTPARRAVLMEQAQLYRTAIAPHRKLPNEILAEIFFLAFDEITVPALYLDDEPPWTLFRVCRRWRQVALGMPTLWTHVHLHYKYREDEDRRWMEMERKVLARSEGLPVSLRITAGRLRGYTISFATPRTPLAQTFREFVVPNARRFRRLELEASDRELDEIFEIPSPQWDLLRCLALNCSRKNSAPKGVVRTFENAPRLRRLDFYLKMFSAPAYSLPWPQITELNLPYSKLHPYAAHEILRQCQNVEACKLSFSDNRYDSCHKPTYSSSSTSAPQDAVSSPITLPVLKSLDVDIYKCSCFGFFLKPLVLPQLITFDVDGETVMVPHPWSPEYIPEIASFERLERLSLKISVPSADIDALLKQVTPLLMTLSLPRGGVLSASTLGSLASGELLPNLKELHCKITDDTLGAHFDMLERRGASAQASSIKAHFYSIHSEADFYRDGGEDVVRFKALEESGLCCYFRG